MFSGDDVEKKVSVLSGGERARLAMAGLLLRPFNLLILDEPTNHLDIPSKEVLKDALMQYDGALIVVSHDRDFLEGLTDRTLEFRDKKLHNHMGDVKAFLEKRQLDNMREVELRQKKQKAAAATPIVTKSAKPELTYEERKELQKNKKKLERSVQNTERKIERLESDVEKWEAKMADSSFYNQPDADAQIAKYKKVQADLEVVMEEWEDAQMALEEFLENN
jgi:ATP-binding cassette subfamily F protein 3